MIKIFDLINIIQNYKQSIVFLKFIDYNNGIYFYRIIDDIFAPLYYNHVTLYSNNSINDSLMLSKFIYGFDILCELLNISEKINDVYVSIKLYGLSFERFSKIEFELLDKCPIASDFEDKSFLIINLFYENS